MYGMIVIWHGAIADIPIGWHLCDGTIGTPDLRNRFVIGAGDTYNPDDIDGAAAHTHNFTSDGHSHMLSAGFGIKSGTDMKIDPANDSGTTLEASSLPPYYALAYIMSINV